MTSSPANEAVEAEHVEQPSLAASRVSTLTDPWSEDEDEDDDDGGVRNSLELVSASRELDRDAGDDADEEGFDLVNSRDLRSSSPVSIVSMSSRDVVPTRPSPQPAAVTSSSSKSEDLVKVLRPGEPAGITRMQPDTDTESWRSSSSASDCSASVGGGTTNTTKSSISVSGSGSESESGRSHDGEDDHAAGAMRLSFPDPIAASLNGHEPATHDQQINDVPRGLGADYSMLLDVTDAAPADSTDSQASSSSSAAASVPASPMSDASRQLSEMSISPDKQAVSSPSSLSSSGTNSSDQIADEMMSTSTSPLLMTTSTPPSPTPPHPRRKQQRHRRSSSPTPLSRSDASLAKQSLLVEQPHALDRDHEEQQRQQYSKSYDPAHVHDWIRSAAEASSPSSSPKPKFGKEEHEDTASDTDSPERVSCVEDQAEQPPVDSEESMQHIEGGEAVRQQQPEQEPAKHDLTISLAGPQSMTSSEATVVPGGGIAKAVAGADGSVPGAMPESRCVSEHNAQAQEQEEEEADTTSSSMQAYAHAPGTARSRKAVAVLSFVAAAVAIAATGWLDSTSTTSPAPVRTLPSSASAPAMNCNAAATTTEEVMMTFSETIRALMMETMVAGSEAEAGAGAGATLITAMSIVSSDHDHDDDDDEDDDQSLSAAFEPPHACHSGLDQHSVEPVETRPDTAPVHVHEEEASELGAHPEDRSVFAPGIKLRELEQLVVSRAQRRMHRHRQRRRGSRRRRRRELLSLFDRAAPPVVHAPNPPVMYVPPAADGTKRRRAAKAPVEVAAADISASAERGRESSWLSAWLRPSAADLVARVSTNALASSLEHGRHALESANHGRRKLARHLERDVATVAKGLQRQHERVLDFTARHRTTCKRSPHLPECFLERLGHRSQRDAKLWWDSIRTHVGGNRQDDVPRSWLDLIKHGRRKADETRALDRAYSRVAPFLARQLETLRLGTRRAQPLTYRGGQETVSHARKVVQALKRVEERVGKRFSAWRRGETSREGRRRKKNKTKNRSRRG